MKTKNPRSKIVLGKPKHGEVKAADVAAPLTYKGHKVTVTVTEPIEAKTSPRHLFMPFFHTELLAGTSTNKDTKATEEFSMSVAINGSALYFKHGKKWYFVKTDALIESILELNDKN